MNHFKDYYDQHKPTIHETDVGFTLEILDKYIMSVGEEDADILTHVVSFLDTTEIHAFINDSLKHYVYKRVFNMALLLFKTNQENYLKDLDLFIDDFQDKFREVYTFHHNDSDDFETLAKEIYKLIQSPQKSRNANLTEKLRKYAEINDINTCYLCGTNVDFDTDYSISLYDARQTDLKQENIDKIEIHHSYILKLLQQLISKPKKFISKLRKPKTKAKRFSRFFFENNYDKNTSLNNFNAIFKDANFKINSKKCEIEHNFPAAWGGDTSNENIFVACHKCNNEKGDIAFYTDIDYSNVFSNSTKINNIKRNISAKTKIAIKIKQKFSCKRNTCINKLGQNKQFYLINENPEYGLTFFSLGMYCEDCIDNIFARSKKITKNEYIKNYCIHLN